MAKILIVDDDVELCRSISERLKAEQHTVEQATDGIEADGKLRVYPYDCIILDWNLPGLSGPEILRNYRQRGGKSSVLMLTGRAELQDKERGLDSGADDYLTKPFSVRELAARVRALLRRPAATIEEKILAAGNVVLNTSNREVKVNEQLIHLRPKEFSILELMLKSKRHTFSTNVLLEQLWNDEPDATVESVRTAMTRLRKKIDQSGEESIIVTVHGVGYKIDCD